MVAKSKDALKASFENANILIFFHTTILPNVNNEHQNPYCFIFA